MFSWLLMQLKEIQLQPHFSLWKMTERSTRKLTNFYFDRKVVWREEIHKLSHQHTAVCQPKRSENISHSRFFNLIFGLWSRVSAPAAKQHQSAASCKQIHILHLMQAWWEFEPIRFKCLPDVVQFMHNVFLLPFLLSCFYILILQKLSGQLYCYIQHVVFNKKKCIQQVTKPYPSL